MNPSKYENLSEEAKKLLQNLPLLNSEVKDCERSLMNELISAKLVWYDILGGSLFKQTKEALDYLNVETTAYLRNFS